MSKSQGMRRSFCCGLMLVMMCVASIDLLQAQEGLDNTRPETDGKPGSVLRIDPEDSRYFAASQDKRVLILGNYIWGTFSDLDYDYAAFFDLLHSYGLNHTRVWLWWGSDFREGAEKGYIRRANPYLRTGPGNANDHRPRYNLERFDPEFFERLRNLCDEAEDREVNLQLVLFDGWFLKDTKRWRDHAFNRENNVNGVDGDPSNTGDGRDGFFSTTNADVLSAQKAYVRKVVEAVNTYDNILFEVANENYTNKEWELAMSSYIHELERGLPKQHLVMPLDLPNHNDYTTRPWRVGPLHEMIRAMSEEGQPVVIDTDGAYYPEDSVVRAAAWVSVLSGGHFSYLDQSLVIGPQSGELYQDERQMMREQLSHIRGFLNQVDITVLQPADNWKPGLPIIGVATSADAKHRQAVVYFPAEVDSGLGLSSFDMPLELNWYDPRKGQWSGQQVVDNLETVVDPPDSRDWVLHIRKHH